MFGLATDNIGELVMEHFNMMDTLTRKTIINLNEADGNQVLVKLASKLYEAIIHKVDNIDFGTIPMSKGDITQIDNYEGIIECVDTMEKLIKEFHQNEEPIKVIKTAIENVKSRKAIFEKGFRYNVEVIMLTYSTITLAIISSTSLMISSCVEMMKSPNQDNFDMSISNVASVRTKEFLLFNNLKKFNKICLNKKLDKSLEHALSMVSDHFVGTATGAIVGIAAVATMIRFIIPMLRELIFFFFSTRMKISDYFEIQGDLLQSNAYTVQMNETLKKSEREQIAKKQLKLANKFKKIANKMTIDNKKSESKAQSEIAGDNKKYKIKELSDELPDSAASSSSLF